MIMIHGLVARFRLGADKGQQFLSLLDTVSMHFSPLRPPPFSRNIQLGSRQGPTGSLLDIISLGYYLNALLLFPPFVPPPPLSTCP